MKKTPFIQKQLSYISQLTNVIFRLGITYFVYVVLTDGITFNHDVNATIINNSEVWDKVLKILGEIIKK